MSILPIRKPLALLLALLVLLACVPPASASSMTANEYVTLTGTTLEDIHRELDELFAYVQFTDPPEVETEFHVIVRQAEHPETYALLVAAMGDDQRFDRYAYVRYCDFMWRHPYNDTYLLPDSFGGMQIFANMGVIYPDTLRFTLSYRPGVTGTGDEDVPADGWTARADAFLRGENAAYPYPVDGTAYEQMQAINRYICLTSYYTAPGLPPTSTPAEEQMGVDCWGYTGMGLYLLRKAGFPTLTVRNYEYLMGGNNAHMWLNTFVEGYWYGVDFNLNDTGWTDPASTAYSEAMLLGSDVGYFPFASDHPVCDQQYHAAKTRPPIVQETPTGLAPAPLAPGMENYTVTWPRLPMPAEVQIVSAGSTSLRVTWSAVEGAREYQVAYSTDPPDAGVRALRTRTVPGGTTEALIEFLQTGVPYYLQVCAYRYTGEGGSVGEAIAPTFVITPGGAEMQTLPPERPVLTALTMKSTATLRVGETLLPVLLLEQLLPAEPTFNSLAWSVSDTDVAKLSSPDGRRNWLGDVGRCYMYTAWDGYSDLVLEGLEPGTVTLTATADYSLLTASCTITVLPADGGEGMKGDVNADSKVDSTDARMVLQHEVKLLQLDETQQAAADVDGNDRVDSTDARMILQYEVALIEW